MALSPESSPGFLLWRTTLAWQRQVAAALRPLDLTHVQFVLLACVWWLDTQGTSPNQAELSAQAGTNVKMTSQVVRSLERKGLVERTVDPADTRARRLRPTAGGTELAPRAIAAVEAADRQFFAPVPTAEAVSLLQRLSGADA